MVTARQYATNALRTEVVSWRAWDGMRSGWVQLVERCPDASFFMTGEWVDAWLATFGEALDPVLVRFLDDDGHLAGACVLVQRTERRGPFTLRRVYFHTSGEGDDDSPYVEFTTLLCEPGRERAMAAALRDVLDDLRWDQFIAPGLMEGPGFTALAEVFTSLEVVDDARPSHYVDLDEVRASGRDYVDALSSRERTSYRQSARKYSELGPLEVDIASTTDEAVALLVELAELHQAGWQERGMGGAFASTQFRRFHGDLVPQLVAGESVELLRLRAGTETIGILYNFVFRNKLYFYQCGYNYTNKKLRPGMITHIFAVRRAAERGLREYDLMAGDADYKRRLASKARSLHWIRWQAPGVKMRAFELLRKTKNKLRERSQR